MYTAPQRPRAAQPPETRPRSPWNTKRIRGTLTASEGPGTTSVTGTENRASIGPRAPSRPERFRRAHSPQEDPCRYKSSSASMSSTILRCVTPSLSRGSGSRVSRYCGKLSRTLENGRYSRSSTALSATVIDTWM